MESRSKEGERPVLENRSTPSGTLSNAMHVKLRVKSGRPRLRLNTPWRPIVNKYREGKVKSTAVSGVK